MCVSVCVTCFQPCLDPLLPDLAVSLRSAQLFDCDTFIGNMHQHQVNNSNDYCIE